MGKSSEVLSIDMHGFGGTLRQIQAVENRDGSKQVSDISAVRSTLPWQLNPISSGGCDS